MASRKKSTAIGRLCVVVALVAGVTAASSSGASLSTFIVPCSTGQLIADIEAANDDISYPGPDTLSLAGSCTYLYFNSYGNGEVLPPITSPVTIIGNGAHITHAGSLGLGFFDVGAGGNLNLSDVTLTDGDGPAGVIHVAQLGLATIVDTTITHATTSTTGGTAIRNQGNLGLIGSTVEFQTNLIGTGGALSNSGQLTVSGSTFASNRATNGAAVYNSGSAEIYDSTFTDNVGTLTAGAILNAGGDLFLLHDSFVDNAAGVDGGAMESQNAADLSVFGSYFEGNHAKRGGAIENSAIAQVVNSTFYRNIASDINYPCCVLGTGGAIENTQGVRVEHSTFDENRAQHGAAIASPSGIISVEASILDTLIDPPCDGTIADYGSNIIWPSVATCPSTFTLGDPKLKGPALNGGVTKTFGLGAGSAAIDVRPPAACPSVDQRGFARPVGPACDAGAFEAQLPTVPILPGLVGGNGINQGVFTISWGASTDPDGGVAYRIYHRDADDSAYSLAATTTSPSYAFTTPEAEGTFRYVVTATDGIHESDPSAESSPVVVDRTGPSAPTATPDRAPDAVGWYRDTVTVTFGGSSDPSLLDGSEGSGVATTTAPQTVATSGAQTVTGKATDVAGNDSAGSTLTVKVDAEPPTVGFTSCPGDIALNAVSSLAWTASDPSSGLATPALGSIPLDTATLGTKSVTASAADRVGHPASATCAYRVVYPFDGFLAPLKNAPDLLDWKAGDGVSVAFGLGGDRGLSVLAAGYPQSTQINCAAPGAATTGVPTSSPQGLTFAKGQNRYHYVWSTQAAWTGTCRQLIVKLVDGTYHRANFRFS